MDSGGYKTRTFNPSEAKTMDGMTHGLYFIFFLLEHVTTVVPGLCLGSALFVGNLIGASWAQTLALAVIIPVTVVVTFAVTMFALSQKDEPDGPADWTKYIDIKDTKLAAKYEGRKIPIEVFVEAYMDRKIDFIVDPLKALWVRHEFLRMNFTSGHLKFFLFKFTGQLIYHSQAADSSEVRDVYDRGNDFYNWFLGPMMIYTSGIFESQHETLEEAQTRKLDLVCRSVRMKPGMEHLDIGCGWGTLICHAAKNYGTKSTGVTLAREQCVWGMNQAKDMGVEENVKMLCMDYRDIPRKTYDVITCLEMIEHVGIKNFQTFLLQCKHMLKDGTDGLGGLFYVQLAGLRRCWCWEDLMWGLFMGTYIFPAADASTPAGFDVTQFERAGFAVHRLENCGVHYSLTINHWYNNWISNREKVVEKYGEWWYRCWVIFLAWSTIIAAEERSTVYCVTLYKNLSAFERRDNFVGPLPIAFQQ